MTEENEVAATGEEQEEEEEEEEYEVQRIVRSKKTKGVSYYLVRWKNYGSDDDTWEPEENLVDCKEVFEEFLAAEKDKAEKKAAKEKSTKKLIAGQKRRRIQEPKSKSFLSSDDDSDLSMSPKSPPVKKLAEKKPVRVKSIVSTDDESDGKLTNPQKSSPVKKEKKTPKAEVKREPKESKRVYKFLSDEDDNMGLAKTPKPEKKKIPKIVKTPKSPPKKSEVLENAARFFDHSTKTNTEVVKMKREKKKKKREPLEHDNKNITPMLHAQPSESASPANDFSSSIAHLEDLVLPFGIDVRVPQADGVHRVTLPIPLEYEDPSGKMSGLENINWTLAVYYDALDLLIKSNCIQDVETLLLKQKLNINQIYGEKTLVSLSVHHGKRRMTDMLLRYNPDVNQSLDKGRIALHIAAELGHTEICVSLIESGSNVNARDAILETPLMKAAEYGHRSTVEMLLDYGSNFSLVNATCKTAEDLAREHQHEFIAQKIHHHGEQIADAFINVHKAGNCLLKEQLLPVHTIFPEFNSTFTLCFTTDRHINCKLIISRLSVRKGDIGKLLDQSAIKCQWMNQILSLEYPGSVVFQPRLGLNTLVLNFKDYIKKYGIEPLLVSAFEVLVTTRNSHK